MRPLASLPVRGIARSIMQTISIGLGVVGGRGYQTFESLIVRRPYCLAIPADTLTVYFAPSELLILLRGPRECIRELYLINLIVVIDEYTVYLRG